MKLEALNNKQHANLKVNSVYKIDSGFDYNFCPVYPIEYTSLQSDYPIFFTKDKDNDTWQTIALLGFKENENLFLGKGVWISRYVPLSIQRLPFYIGSQKEVVNGIPSENKILHIDLDHPGINESDGNEIFLEHGGNSEYLNYINNILSTIHKEANAVDIFCKEISNLDLLKLADIKIDFNENESHELKGLYVIDEEKLKNLDKENLYKLHIHQYLQHIYMIGASIGNVNKLISLKRSK